MANNLIDDSYKFAALVITLVLIFILQKIVQFFIVRFAVKNKKVPPDAINGIKVIVRLLAAVSILYSIMIIYDLPPEQIVGISAVLGAMVSFASVQAIQNFFAGIYILITHPFGVEDLVRLGETDGLVLEISLNYTKLKTIDEQYLYIPNKTILNSTIINFNRKVESKSKITNKRLKRLSLLKTIFDEDEIVRYSFQWGAPLSDLDQAKAKIELVCEKYSDKAMFGYKPEFFLYNISHRMEFQFIVQTDYAEKILAHITDFRDEICLLFH